MIIGAHTIISSRKPGADRAFLRDVLRLPHVDAGEGWLIFGLPPAEVAIHPARRNNLHQLYFMCDDIGAFVRRMKARGVGCGRVQQMPWGRLSQVRLPGGGAVGVYEPHHARPKPMRARAMRRRKAP